MGLIIGSPASTTALTRAQAAAKLTSTSTSQAQFIDGVEDILDSVVSAGVGGTVVGIFGGTASYTPVAGGTFNCLITAVGGGGGGGAGDNSGRGQYGGGAGGGLFRIHVIGATSISWVIGAAGVGAQTTGSQATGGDGDSTTITITGGTHAGTIVCPGGGGGIGYPGDGSDQTRTGAIVTGTSSLVSNSKASQGITATSQTVSAAGVGPGDDGFLGYGGILLTEAGSPVGFNGAGWGSGGGGTSSTTQGSFTTPQGGNGGVGVAILDILTT